MTAQKVMRFCQVLRFVVSDTLWSMMSVKSLQLLELSPFGMYASCLEFREGVTVLHVSKGLDFVVFLKEWRCWEI